MSDPRTVFPDNVYHTLSYTNDGEQAAQLKFPTNSDSIILANPMMYYALVEKFVLSNRAFPIFDLDNTDGKYFTRALIGGVNIELKIAEDQFFGDLIKIDGAFPGIILRIYFN